MQYQQHKINKMGFRKMRPDPTDCVTHIISQELGPKWCWSVTTLSVQCKRPEYEEKGSLCMASIYHHRASQSYAS